MRFYFKKDPDRVLKSWAVYDAEKRKYVEHYWWRHRAVSKAKELNILCLETKKKALYNKSIRRKKRAKKC